MRPDEPQSKRRGYAGGSAGATEAPRDDPGAGREDRAVAGRRLLCAARHAGVGRDGGARARRGRRAGLRGRSDRPRAARRRHGSGGAAGRQPGGLLEAGARARGAARAPPGRPPHPGGRRRRRARPRAGAGPTARRPARRRHDRVADRPAERRLGGDRRARAVVTIGDALPGVPAVGEVVFDNKRGVEDDPPPPHELGHRRVAVLSWAAETSPGRRAERAVARAARARDRVRDRAMRLLAERLAAAGGGAAVAPPTGRARCSACPTRSPTASTWRAPSSGCGSPGTCRSPGSTTTRSRACCSRR